MVQKMLLLWKPEFMHQCGEKLQVIWEACLSFLNANGALV